MTSQYIQSSVVGADNVVNFTADNQAMVILPGVFVGSTSEVAIGGLNFNDISLSILGTLSTHERLRFDGVAAYVFVGAVGSYSSNPIDGNGIMTFAGSDAHLDNQGSITSQSGRGVLFDGENGSVQNSGFISGQTGIDLQGSGSHRIVNSGTIVATTYGDAENGTDRNNAINSFGTNNIITNLAGGQILAEGVTGSGIRISEFAGGNQVWNHGTIYSAQDFGINLSEVNIGQAMVKIHSTGLIQGGDGSIIGSVNTDSVTNRGLLLGAVDMGGGNDTLDNRGGTIEGDVLLGDGTDVLDNRGGTITGSIDGGLGNDTFLMGAGIEVINGSADLDAIDFRGTPAVVVSLDDSVPATGHAAGDEYVSIELVYGSYFADQLTGNAQANTLRGYGGNDTLNGGAGADKMVGGKGVDLMTGGAGSDTFVFDALSEVGDVITDFGSSTGNHDMFNIRASAFGGGLVVGTLAASAFQSRADNVAQDADDRFIFRTTDKTLWFDADGSGTGAAVMLADLQASAVVDRFDIVIF